MKYAGVLILALTLCEICLAATCTEKEIQANLFLEVYNEQLKEKKYQQISAGYEYNTNVTEQNRLRAISITIENSEFFKAKANEMLDQGFQYLEDENIARQVKKLTQLGYAALNDDDYTELLDSISSMKSNYAKVKVCSYLEPENCDLSLEPEIEARITKSRDPEELKYYWTKWYDMAGTPTRMHFDKYIELSRKSAKLNNFDSNAESWIDAYEDPEFVEKLERIYHEILPFYKELHGYVRNKLRQHYGEEHVSERGPIPLHLTGNLWGQAWDEIIDILTPYPDTPFFDVTNEMVKQGYTPIKMFEMGDEFFQSINMTKLPASFWEKSLLEKPSDGRTVICHASAWDMFQWNDVRIKQCTRVTMQQFYVVHHELGHIQYYLQYQPLPVAFRRAPNPGFHEAVGDVLAMSVSTPKHLLKIGLLTDYDLDEKLRINLLFKKAIKKIAFLPFSYTLDKYRWAIFRGEINETDYNCAFWKMRSDFSGLEPPVERSNSDFDPPAKYHVSADVEYLRYFVAHVFQFQFLKSACAKAGQYVHGDSNLTLDNCDIYESSEAGNAFKEMLELGASKHWSDALEVFTGERDMSASAMLEYFEPLRSWLEAENKKNNVFIGWEPSDKCKSN